MLREKIENYIGSFADSKALNDWLTAGAQLHIRLMPPGELDKFSSTITDSGNGVDVKDKIVLSVDKNGYESKPFPSSMYGQLTDNNSLHKATALTPAHYVKSGKLHIVPGGGTAEAVTLPTVKYSDSEIAELPKDLEDATVLYAAIQAQLRTMNDAIGQVSVSYTPPADVVLPAFPTAPVLPNAPALSAAPSVITLDDFVATVTLDNPPSYSSVSKHADIESDYNKADTELVDDDIEMLGGYLQKVKTQLDEYQLKLNEAIGEYQADIRSWDGEQQQKINNHRTELEKWNSKQQQKISKYRADIEKYSAEERMKIESYLGEVRGELDSYSTQVQAISAEHSSLVSNYRNQVESDIAGLRIELESSAGKVQMLASSIESMRGEYRTKLTPYIDSK